MKKFFGFLILILTLSTACSPAEEATIVQEEQLKIVASFYPLGFFAEQIGGDLVDLSVVVPATVEPHDYEPSPVQLKAIYDADLFLYNGAGFEPWAEDIAADLDEQSSIFKAAESVDLLPWQTDVIEESDGTEWDPHFWLDPVRAQTIVQDLSQRLGELDPANANTYAANASVLIGALQSIDENFSNTLGQCSGTVFITSHAAFSYIADRYGLTMISIRGLSPGDEPSLKELEEIVEVIETQHVPVIYTEALLPASYAETLSKETGATVLELNPIEGLRLEDMKNGENYLTLMRKNLGNLELGLNCPSH